ncbi:MAG TPA: hypothetical protein VKN36_01505, partial [Eudoraea sp.]|nr:hypothetical protein [Eudoraea sp.]
MQLFPWERWIGSSIEPYCQEPEKQSAYNNGVLRQDSALDPYRAPAHEGVLVSAKTGFWMKNLITTRTTAHH